jgi:L-galactose dehydrogenase
MKEMEYRPLDGTDLHVSVIGFGASPLGNEFGVIDPEEGERAVRHAIDSGINFFDVSPYYGRTLAEERLGKSLAGHRSEVVLATKCGRYDVDRFDFSAGRVMASVEESLRRLRTDYLDILHAHDIEFGDREQIVDETIPALRKLKEQGKVRFIGVTGLPLDVLADAALRGHTDVVMSYCRYNLLVRDLDTDLAPVLREHGIGLLNASPLHMGILTECGPPAWHPAAEEVQQAGKAVADICRRRGTSVSTVALRFCLDYPRAASTVIGMSRSSEVDANLRALATTIDSALQAEIDQAVQPVLNRVWHSGRRKNGK